MPARCQFNMCMCVVRVKREEERQRPFTIHLFIVGGSISIVLVVMRPMRRGQRTRNMSEP